MPNLTSLRLGAAQSFGDEGARLLAGTALLASEPTLRMNGAGLTDEGIALLAASPHLSKIVELDSNAIGEAGARALASSPNLAALEQLDLSSTGLGPKGVAALADAGLPSLSQLDLAGNLLGPEGAQALAQGKGLAALRELGLAGCRLQEGVLALIAVPRFERVSVDPVEHSVEELRALSVRFPAEYPPPVDRPGP